ncbi:hypothetical protein P7K49_025060 [Saguinus oedipus]|uniref:Transposase n=1 Tax=Saguinus oedipus TaxID=9490 RepID=A0ABQ9UG50_SAGOE|nr:hypothetical protein P7K49_025060 [Saguinus oedipus]
MMGRMGPDAGLGVMRHALACRALRLRIFRAFWAGWLNHVATRHCQSLWKWGFKIMPFRLGAMADYDPATPTQDNSRAERKRRRNTPWEDSRAGQPAYFHIS